MRNFENKVAVITGAGSGIGAALAWRFAREGMRIVVSDIDEAAANATAAALAEAGHTALATRTDVADALQVEALAALAYQAFGAVDMLFNNAGIVPAGRLRPVWEYPPEDWQWSIDVNLMGVVHGIRSFVPRMLAQGTEGHVVTTASVAGLISGSASVPYAAAKHGAVLATEALYAALRERDAPIGVTLLCPGLVNTRIYHSERNRPEQLQPRGGAAAETPELHAMAPAMYAGALTPDQVAEQVFDAVWNKQLYALTSANFDDAIRERTEAILERRNPVFARLLDLSRKPDAQTPSVPR
ncbi:SDR family NAD(P)-dependent oxidoreductase [Duganella hordei]|uniref:SDR family NAD(P)-dependent oxidoreductase n=1 Tax=Duganella hordei TaxID=2865934 RepID=UPI0030E83276